MVNEIVVSMHAHHKNSIAIAIYAIDNPKCDHAAKV